MPHSLYAGTSTKMRRRLATSIAAVALIATACLAPPPPPSPPPFDGVEWLTQDPIGTPADRSSAIG